MIQGIMNESPEDIRLHNLALKVDVVDLRTRDIAFGLDRQRWYLLVMMWTLIGMGVFALIVIWLLALCLMD